MTTGGRTAYHFGPSTAYVGGMASVIATLVELRLGADVVRAVPTWQPDSHFRSGVLTVGAVVRTLLLPSSTVIHVHMSEGGSFVREAAILAAAKLRRMRRIVTIHGYSFARFSIRWPRLVARVLRMASAVIVLSESDRARVRTLVPHVPVELIPNPMPLDPAAGPVSDTDEVVLFAGELGVRKGADVLHRAWTLVSTSRPTAKCVMVGPPTELPLPSLDRLEVLGPASPERVRELIRSARVIALPSRAESLPMVLSEAMAAGRPFVSTPTGGVTSLAQGGIIVPVDDDRELAGALIALLADPSRAQSLGSAGEELCRSWMAPTTVDARLRRLYSLDGAELDQQHRDE
jgi:glycosyltransferase involved in cell wall biosynthesis